MIGCNAWLRMRRLRLSLFSSAHRLSVGVELGRAHAHTDSAESITHYVRGNAASTVKCCAHSPRPGHCSCKCLDSASSTQFERGVVRGAPWSVEPILRL